MIDLTTETAIPLTQAAKLIPPGRSGRKTHLSTLLRWVEAGAAGPGGSRVRLEALRLGGRWVTSREAIQRFAEALTPALTAPSPSPSRTLKQRETDNVRAARELEAAGI